MSNGANRTWAFGTIALCGIIAAAGYMMAIRPQLDQIAEINDQTTAAREYNDLLDTQILTAKATAKEVPLWRGTLAAIDIDMPPQPEQPELHRLMVQALEARGLPVMGITFGSPVVLLAPLEPEVADDPAAAPDDPADTDEPAPEDRDATEPESEPTPAPATPTYENLVGVPVTVTTQGSPGSAMEWFKYVQTQDDRFLTVVGFQIGPAQDEAREGIPPVQPGDWSITLNMMAFSLLDPERSFPIEEPGSNPPYTSGSPTVPVEGDAPPAA